MEIIFHDYIHKTTGKKAQLHGLYEGFKEPKFIKYYWSVFGLPDNFYKEDVENPELFDKVKKNEAAAFGTFLQAINQKPII